MYRAGRFQKNQMPVDEFGSNVVREGIVVVQSVFALFLIGRNSIGCSGLSDSIDTGIDISKKDIIQCLQCCIAWRFCLAIQNLVDGTCRYAGQSGKLFCCNAKFVLNSSPNDFITAPP